MSANVSLCTHIAVRTPFFRVGALIVVRLRFLRMLFLLWLAACGAVPRAAPGRRGQAVAEPSIEWDPRRYVCYRAFGTLKLDGRLDDAAWKAAPSSWDFVDILGGGAPAPRYRTRVKMLWDDEFFYVGAELEEPHVWATLTQRDSVIFHDNDFEVFLDPNGDTHEYFELEVNAFATEWDLFLGRPYRDGGPPLHQWDIPGLKTAVSIDGTINDPSDRDTGWSVEIAIPWVALRQGARRPVPPKSGDQWRVNFSRVQWQTVIKNGGYQKVKGTREDNWVWSPQGIVNMHYPEMWGFVQFSHVVAGRGMETVRRSPDEEARGVLRRVYYRQRRIRAETGRYSIDAEELRAAGLGLFVHATPELWEASLPVEGGRIHIRQDGRTWATKDAPLSASDR